MRNSFVDPMPIGPLSAMLVTGLGELLDVSIHPEFATNQLIHMTYSKLSESAPNTTTAPPERLERCC